MRAAACGVHLALGASSAPLLLLLRVAAFLLRWLRRTGRRLRAAAPHEIRRTFSNRAQRLRGRHGPGLRAGRRTGL